MSNEDGQDNDPVKGLAHLFQSQEASGDKVVPLRRPAAAADPAPAAEDDGKKKKKEKAPKIPREYIALGDDCPVKPLGVNGSDYYFLDALNQLVVKHADKLGQNGIDDLFKHSNAQRWADNNFGRIGEGGIINGIDRDLLKRALIAKCGDLSMGGVFDPSGAVRGSGVWQDEVGRLVFHCGDTVITYDHAGKAYAGAPGLRDSLAYPLGTRQMRPADEAPEQGAAVELLNICKTWQWKRSKADLDAMLMLGWMTTAAVGGALLWRPAMWLTGDMSTGKSTLQELIQGIQGGPHGVIQAADSTAAGIWQALKFRSLPVALDEVEASADNTRKQQVVDLMRLNASGARLRRGGGDHNGVEFNLFSCFLFSSINMLPLPPQDLSRLAMLELQELPREARRPKLDPKRLGLIGAALRRRVIQAWPRWEEHLAPWWEPINNEFGRRTADTYSTLLAMAHIAVCDHVAHDDIVAEQIEPLIPSLREWQVIAGKDYQLLLNRLATWQLEPWDRGERVTIRRLIYWASSRAPAASMSANDGLAFERFGKHIDRSKAGGALRQNGLAVTTLRKGEALGTECLAVAFRHSSLTRIFAKTSWQDGGWRQSAARTPGADSRKTRFESDPEGAVFVPIAAILGEETTGEEGA